ncbi:bifunctional oligoribonuclease/PAP phosphatase NrnA [Halorhabdus sp. CBA1104]|uniref:DHH family phosphoesterase n=1 Tax=Halorhabdus sp. CBA1104 TaxID=1380432 RepID=UPI0012B43E1F|nr:DHH family phosphoesterase [Halorhabdus sp. CBA1104]QGN06391.1 bifunctional oligoribonuclease/PAP phosphatase NrnA [Halorhabdus sp. CBA1104]
MRTRLVVGCGRLGATLIDTLSDRPGRVVVVVPGERATALRERFPSVDVTVEDPTEPGVFETLPDADSVLVAGDDPARNLETAELARDAFPAAFLLAYAGLEPPADIRQSLANLADRLVDPPAVFETFLTERVETGETTMHELRKVVADIDGPLAVVMHDNPDPDAIASAVALRRLIEYFGCSAQACYYGSINHQENRAMVNLLEYELRNLDAESDLTEFGGFALVDHARPGVNDGLPEDTPVDIVIDHHPPRGPVSARFADLRSDAGATSTLLVDYYRRLGVDIEPAVATGLLFGIRVDTDEFSREVSVADFEAGAELLANADLGRLERVENPSVSSDTVETIAAAIRRRQRHGSVLLSGVGAINDRDTLAQAADRLLNLEEITTTLVYGIIDGTVYISARSRGTDLDLGETLRAAFGQIGSAGGHAEMAGAQIELGVLESIDGDDPSLVDIVDELVADQFLDVLDLHPSRASLGTYGQSDESAVDVPESDSWVTGGSEPDRRESNVGEWRVRDTQPDEE